MNSHAECAAGACVGAALGAILHDTYFVLSFISVATGAFLGIVGFVRWLREPKGDK